jgi:hypothetical protein
MGLRGLLEPGLPGKRSASASALSEEAGAAVYLAASYGRAASATITITVASITAMQLEVDMDGTASKSA